MSLFLLSLLLPYFLKIWLFLNNKFFSASLSAFSHSVLVIMADSNHPQSSRFAGPSQSLLGTIQETSDEFVGSLLRDSPEASNVATGSGQPSPNMDDSQGPLDVMPLRSIMGPPANVPPT
ncbi:hypothetical protein LIER_11084 [Lithospermum erythrorhizon]|uniref:Uncharacterized protein n=1 Tax=Lithospermum erythrorhizon TaxID=34254 RepID=A0AAV3PN00_LITER